MKIAVTYENGQIFQHFGHTQFFKVYEVKDGKMSSALVPVSCGGHSALAGMLESLGVDTLICGGIGMGAQVALDNADINLYAGVTGSADEAVAKLLAGVLPQNASANCSHHDHDHHHHDGCGCHDHDHHHHDGCGCHDHDHHHHDGHERHCHDCFSKGCAGRILFYCTGNCVKSVTCAKNDFRQASAQEGAGTARFLFPEQGTYQTYVSAHISNPFLHFF